MVFVPLICTKAQEANIFWKDATGLSFRGAY